jgi:hypothetical protein
MMQARISHRQLRDRPLARRFTMAVNSAGSTGFSSVVLEQPNGDAPAQGAPARYRRRRSNSTLGG